MDTSDHRISRHFKESGMAANCLTGIKNALVKCLHVETSEELMSGEHGGCISKIKCLRTYDDVNFVFLFWCGQHIPQYCPSI